MENDIPTVEIGLEGYSDEEMDAAALSRQEAAEKQEEYRKNFELEQQQAKENNEILATQEAEQKEKDKKKGLGYYLKDTAVGVAGGVQDTASSLVTLPERIIDYFTGEMGRENKEGGYKAEWDDWFVDDDNHGIFLFY